MNFKKRLATGIFLIAITAFQSAWAANEFEINTDSEVEARATRTVNIPGADFFLPMVMNIRAGDMVQFTNNDEDPHTVTTDPAYSSFFYQGINATVKAKASGHPGVVKIRFKRRGTFTYYCRNHAHLVGGQPVTGGVVGPGEAGRPMMGIIIIR
jgi:plastocyanin